MFVRSCVLACLHVPLENVCVVHASVLRILKRVCACVHVSVHVHACVSVWMRVSIPVVKHRLCCLCECSHVDVKVHHYCCV